MYKFSKNTTHYLLNLNSYKDVDDNDPNTGENKPLPNPSMIDLSSYNWIFYIYFVIVLCAFIAPFIILLTGSLTYYSLFWFYFFSYPAVAIRYTLAYFLNKPNKFPYATIICNISIYYNIYYL